MNRKKLKETRFQTTKLENQRIIEKSSKSRTSSTSLIGEHTTIVGTKHPRPYRWWFHFISGSISDREVSITYPIGRK